MQFISENRLNGCQIFWTVRFLKTESEPKFGFPHIPMWESVDVQLLHLSWWEMYPQLACDSLLQSMCVVLVFDMHKSSRSRNLDIIFVLTLIPIYFNNKLSWCWQTCAMRLGSVEVTKHSTIPYVRYSVLLYSSNFVFKMRHFLIVVFKICDLKIRVRGHWW